MLVFPFDSKEKDKKNTPPEGGVTIKMVDRMLNLQTIF